MSAAEKLPELYTEAQAATYLGVAVVTLRRMRKREQIGFIRIGAKPMYTEHHILKFLEQQTCPPASASATTGLSSERARPSGTEHGVTTQAVSSALRSAQEILRKQRSH